MAYKLWDKVFEDFGGTDKNDTSSDAWQKAWTAYNNADANLRDLDINDNNLNWEYDIDKFNNINNLFNNVSQNKQFHFNPDQATFVNEEQENQKLDQLADYIKKSNDQIDVSGYIANVDNMYPNSTLPQERADTIKNALIQRGVDVSKINPSLGKGTGKYDNSYWNPENRYVEVGSLTTPEQSNFYKAITNNGNTSTEEINTNNINPNQPVKSLEDTENEIYKNYLDNNMEPSFDEAIKEAARKSNGAWAYERNAPTFTKDNNESNTESNNQENNSNQENAKTTTGEWQGPLAPAVTNQQTPEERINLESVYGPAMTQENIDELYKAVKTNLFKNPNAYDENNNKYYKIDTIINALSGKETNPFAHLSQNTSLVDVVPKLIQDNNGNIFKRSDNDIENDIANLYNIQAQAQKQKDENKNIQNENMQQQDLINNIILDRQQAQAGQAKQDQDDINNFFQSLSQPFQIAGQQLSTIFRPETIFALKDFITEDIPNFWTSEYDKYEKQRKRDKQRYNN